MAQDNSNSTMEMGTSDQVLVQKKSKKTTYIIGFVAMLVAIGAVIALVVVFSGNEGGNAEPIVSTTEGPTTIVPPSPTTTTAATTTTTAAPEPEPEAGPDPLELDEIINGMFSPASFNGSFTTGNNVLFRNVNGDLVLYDVESDDYTPLISNSSESLQLSSRVTSLAPDGVHVVLALGVIPVYRYSFLARYVVVDTANGNESEVVPQNILENDDGYIQNFVWGPSGTSLAFVYRNNIYYQSSFNGNQQQITENGMPNVIYNGIPDWVYEEEVFSTNNALYFSKDGIKLAYVTFDDTNVRIMRVPHYGVPGSVNYQYTQHHEIRYPKAGTTNPIVYVTLRDLSSGVSYVYDAPGDIEQAILRSVNFVSNETIALTWSNRVQTYVKVVLCTFGQNICTEIFEYVEDGGWVENIPLIFNEQGTSFITILPQAVNGMRYKQIVQVTEGTTSLWVSQSRTNIAHTVLEILRWTSDDVIWYKATHVNDSAQQHIYTVNSASAVDCFTCDIRREDGGACLYNEANLNEDGQWITLTCAGPGVPQVYIYGSDGTLRRVWEDNEATTTLLANRRLPETLRVSIPVADGFPEADVQIQVPADYQNRNNVPLLVYVYTGPDSSLVTHQWSISWGSSLVSRWGIAVAQIDARGSGLRGIENMFAVNRRLGTVEIEDQINVTRALHERFPWLDSNRTCVWGWSYGGYTASLALARGGDTFRCAMAVAPVVDWRFYDTIYTERYMDLPANNTVGYAQSSLLANDVVEAYRNKSYYLVHGTADDNVHYQHAMLLSRLLQRQDVYFTQMSYTDEDHGLVGVRPHVYHGFEKFLQENML